VVTQTFVCSKMKPTTSYTVSTKCVYCGERCIPATTVVQSGLSFCCFGCSTLYDLHENIDDYQWSDSDVSIEYKQYDLEEVFNQLVDFQNDKIYKLTISAPSIYCASCVELLEDLPEINDKIFRSHVNFENRDLTLTVSKELPISHVAMLLDKLGYPPQFNITKKAGEKSKRKQQDLLRKVAVAGFCFGNTMMLSLPHYFGLSIASEPFFVSLFRYLNVALSILVLAYPAKGYFKTAFESIANRKSHIDIPIVLGIIAIWAWSIYEIIGGIGFGYLDSLAGLIFFLLVGKWYQNKVYSKITFERSIHEFLPLSVRTKNKSDHSWTRVDDLQIEDIVVVKNSEVIPINGRLKNGNAIIDYSFVTGESVPEIIQIDDEIYIGGKQTGGEIEIEITTIQDTSKIWSAWKTPKTDAAIETHWTTVVSQYFTPLVLLVAIVALAAWMYIDSTKALFVFSSVLIVACPCALALSTPFTYGSISRVFGRNKLFLKQADTVDKLSYINHIIFDKTGTLTSNRSHQVVQHGAFTNDQLKLVKSVCANSNHPYSVAIVHQLENTSSMPIDTYEEIEGRGIIATIGSHKIRIGSSQFLNALDDKNSAVVYVEIDGEILGHFGIQNSYRTGLGDLLKSLGKHFNLSILSGDNSAEKNNLTKVFSSFKRVLFNQTPEDKKEYIKTCHQNGDNTIMIGDGLNDQVALNQSDVGIAVTENVTGFYPNSDGILMSEHFNKLPRLLALSRYAKVVLKASLAFSVFYNLIGITFAVAGSLTPIVAAILMPLSSITVVGLVTALVSFKAKKLQLL
jgi:P-type Cu+ transporter